MSRAFYALVLVGMLGCAHKEEKKVEAPVQPPPAAPAATPPQAATTNQSMCATDLDCGPAQICLDQHCVDIASHLEACTNVRVHFPLNSDEMDPADRPSLDRSARCLKADQKLHITIEGNADERGTEEYNMALGDRRARNVMKYLESMGASQAQLATVSFGKENPECQEHDEACWARNRRAALKAGQEKGKKK